MSCMSYFLSVLRINKFLLVYIICLFYHEIDAWTTKHSGQLALPSTPMLQSCRSDSVL